MPTENRHLVAYQEVYPTAARLPGKNRNRYFLTDTAKSVCWACLGEHESISCAFKRCYRCAQPGHESGQCRSTEFCDYCNSSGHSSAKHCYLRAYQMGMDPRSHDTIQCIACGEMGHMNCAVRAEQPRVGSFKRRRSD